MIKDPIRTDSVLDHVNLDALNRQKKVKSRFGNALLFTTIVIIFVAIIIIFIDIISNGIEVLGIEFLTSMPTDSMTKGGILPAIIGTFFVTIITALFSIPFGILTAIYLNEYSRDSRSTRFIRLAIRNLSGVPSIVYGIFGVALFVDGLGFGSSILSAGLTLGLLTIPWTITASEEALKSVPISYREGSMALGATKWYTIRKNVLPFAAPGIITGAILGLARAAGETAPILFTGAAYMLPGLPGSIFDQFMALPYHIYTLALNHPQTATVRPLAYGTALVLILLISTMSLFAIFLRIKIRKKMTTGL